MDLFDLHEKYVRMTTIYGETFTGTADHFPASYCMHEYGVDEEGVRVDGYIAYASQIASIERVVPHGTAELRTERLTLRRYRMEDADELYRALGTDPEAKRYSGWDPYATPEAARETVRRFIDGYGGGERCYSWVMDYEDVPAGTIGAYGYDGGSIEAGFTVAKRWRGRGFAAEALRAVLAHLTENEGIPRVTAWCAAENVASRRTLEKAGMRLVHIEKGGLAVGGQVYDKLIYGYERA